MPADEWRESVDYFMRMIPLENKTARRQVRRLMVALDRDSLEILRVARRLEDPDFTPKDYDWLRKRYRPRPHQHVLQTWHGTMLKRLALDRSGVGLRTRIAVKRESRRWDALLAQNAYSARIFRSA